MVDESEDKPHTNDASAGEEGAEKKEDTGGPGKSEEAEGETGGKGGARRRGSKLWTPSGEHDVRPEGEEGEPAEEEVSDEELRRRVEEALEKITVADVIIDMMISLSSLAYQRMGIPHETNQKYRDMEQARLAIDCLDALLSALRDRLPEETLQPLTGTLDNLKLNYARES